MLHLIWYIIVGFIAGCVAKALTGISAGGAAPDKTTVPELRLRLRPDARLDAVKFTLPK